MFGFGKGRLKRELAALEATADQHRYDLPLRMRRADLVAELEGPHAALPHYEAIAGDFPKDRQIAFTVAEYKLFAGDPEAMERLAEACPGLAVPCCTQLIPFYHAQGNAARLEELHKLMEEGIADEKRATAEFRLHDPGGPLEAPNLSEETRAAVRDRMSQIPGLEYLLAGERTLDGGYLQSVLVYGVSPDCEDDDFRAIYAQMMPTIELLGDTAVWPATADWEWLRTELAALEGSQLYP